ncbi:TetR/AcrR family transcriptional regulator [Microbulbifer taiwanensis]|uniref:TetR/AcrR family transcriptional regulator n=1 Tax=Microbulbifer taiwanensis TaxID=986746 RepID=UPI003617C9ED
MSQTDTVSRILDAAEVLFAERGFTETSLRTITSTAGVNLAAVNYHFGSKKN